MKPTALFAFLAVLPLLSGCLSGQVTQAAKYHTVETSLYDSTDRIENAAVIKDDQLCVFFEHSLSNSLEKKHFSLTIPLAEIQTNVQFHDVAISPDGNGAIYFHTERSPNRHTWWTLQVPGGRMNTSRTLQGIPEGNLNYIPVATALTHLERYHRPLQNPTILHDKDFTLLSNATQTVYLTRTNPIEFVYVAPSIKQPFTIVSVSPTVVSKKNTDRPAYYLLLPLTVPVDIATSPIQIPFILWLGYGNWHM